MKINNLTSELNSVKYLDQNNDNDKDNIKNDNSDIDDEDYDTKKLNNILSIIDSM